MLLNDMNIKDIIELYRNRVESRDDTPPDSCWDEISTRLDIEDTWSSISTELAEVLPDNDVSKVLQVKNQISVPRIISVVSPLTLILMMFLFSDIRKDNKVNSLVPDNEITIVSTVQPAEYQKIIPEQKIPVYKADEPEAVAKADSIPVHSKKETVYNASEPVLFQIEDTTPKVVSAEQNSVTGLIHERIGTTDITTGSSNRKFISPFVPAEFPLDNLTFNLVAPVPVFLTSPKTGDVEKAAKSSNWNGSSVPGRKLNLNNFSVGISLTEKNTWLISQETFDGLSRQNLNTSQIKFLNDFGIIVRYIPNEKWSVEGSGFFISKTGQAYKQYQHGVYTAKSYDLRYASFEMNTRFTWHKSLNFSNIRLYTIAGAYISHLNSAYKIVNQQQYDVSSEYNPVDFGLITGYEVEIMVLDRIAIAPGFRVKFGIPNIFSDKPELPKELHATRNASLEFRLNITFPLKFF
jgi:hypothetical protein